MSVGIETVIDTFLGCDIYIVNLGTTREPDYYYGSPCIAGQFGTKRQVKIRICEKKGGTWEFFNCTITERREPELVETYRGVDIYYLPFTNNYTATTEDGYWAGGDTVEEVRTRLDEILGPVAPPPPPRFTCPTCGAYFNTQEELDHHISIAHPEPPPPVVPPDPEDDFISLYAGYEIWQRAVERTFYIMVDGVATGEFQFIGEATAYIENVLLEIPPYEPPPPIIPPDIVPGEEAEQLGNIGELMGRYGTPGTLGKDSGMAGTIAKPINDFLTSLGLTSDALQGVLGSGADPEKAAQFAASISTASVGAVALLGTVGVLAEVASLGQIEGVLGTVDMVLDKTGIGSLMDELFKLPFMSALVTPARHHWNSMYTPEIPGIGELVTFLVREVITPEEFEKNVALHGLSKYWADAHWEVHWRLPSIGDIIRAHHLGIITTEERDAYFILHDYRSDPRPFRAPYEMIDPTTGETVPEGTLLTMSVSDLAIYGGLTKTLLGRVDTRRAYQYGKLERPDLIKMYQAQGYEEDSELQADIQILASVAGLQSSIRREEGMMYRDRLKDAKADEATAVSKILKARDAEILVTTIRLYGLEAVEAEDVYVPTEVAERAAELGSVSEEEAAVIEADLRSKADIAIAEVRVKARAREEEVEDMYRTALEEVKTIIDPEDLWVLRYKLAAARVEVAEEFEIEIPVEVVETPEEPE